MNLSFDGFRQAVLTRIEQSTTSNLQSAEQLLRIKICHLVTSFERGQTCPTVFLLKSEVAILCLVKLSGIQNSNLKIELVVAFHNIETSFLTNVTLLNIFSFRNALPTCYKFIWIRKYRIEAGLNCFILSKRKRPKATWLFLSPLWHLITVRSQSRSLTILYLRSLILWHWSFDFFSEVFHD